MKLNFIKIRSLDELKNIHDNMYWWLNIKFHFFHFVRINFSSFWRYLCHCFIPLKICYHFLCHFHFNPFLTLFLKLNARVCVCVSACKSVCVYVLARVFVYACVCARVCVCECAYATSRQFGSKHVKLLRLFEEKRWEKETSRASSSSSSFSLNWCSLWHQLFFNTTRVRVWRGRGWIRNRK